MSDSPDKQPLAGNRLLWIGLGIFSVVGLILTILVGVFIARETTPSIAQDSAREAPTAAGAGPSTAPPNGLREHQSLVGEVLGDLERDFVIGDSPTRGNPDATIVLLEFSDFQCPFCARATQEIDTFMADSEAEVLLVYKHLPLSDIHPQAVPAALASWAADQQGKFWAFHDALFANQEALEDSLYEEIAQDLDLDLAQFNRDRQSEAAQAAIARDLALAAELQISSTPTFIMGGLLIPGVIPADLFAEALARLQAFQEQNADTAPE
ncbi:MAG: thioredoxin domain-containing protein [Cyanobacteria bacterium P01_H01_bin.58]